MFISFLYLSPAFFVFLRGLFEPSWEQFWYQALCWSGDFSVIFFFVTMVTTPLKIYFPKNNRIKRLARFRRETGIATFLYALIHVLSYIVHRYLKSGSIDFMMFLHPFIVPGTITFLIFFLLAITSNNWSMRWLGWKRWKKLHRWSHFCQWLVLIHLLCVDIADRESSALIPTLLMGLLLAFQMYKWRLVRKHADGLV